MFVLVVERVGMSKSGVDIEIRYENIEGSFQ